MHKATHNKLPRLMIIIRLYQPVLNFCTDTALKDCRNLEKLSVGGPVIAAVASSNDVVLLLM